MASILGVGDTHQRTAWKHLLLEATARPSYLHIEQLVLLEVLEELLEGVDVRVALAVRPACSGKGSW